MLVYIRNMVCNRCRMAVRTVFEDLQLHVLHVDLGEVLIEETALTEKQRNDLSAALQALGFELIDDRKAQLIEQVKTYIIELVHTQSNERTKKYSELLSQHLLHDYSYLSNLFSDVEGITIEQYIIHQKIERVKELLAYDEQSLSQIAFDLGYSSTAHLSAQFKKLTGLTPSVFKQTKHRGRKPLDEIGKQKIL